MICETRLTVFASPGKVEETNDMLFGRDATATNSPYCGKPPHVVCLIACAKDNRCEILGYNRTGVSCGCPCQRCDGKVYGATNDYKNATPSTVEQRNNCLDVTHPCKTSY